MPAPPTPRLARTSYPLPPAASRPRQSPRDDGRSPDPRMLHRSAPPLPPMRSAAVTDGVLGTADGLAIRMTQVPLLADVDQTAEQDPVHALGVPALRATSTTNRPSANQRSQTRAIRPMRAPIPRRASHQPLSWPFGMSGRKSQSVGRGSSQAQKGCSDARFSRRNLGGSCATCRAKRSPCVARGFGCPSCAGACKVGAGGRGGSQHPAAPLPAVSTVARRARGREVIGTPSLVAVTVERVTPLGREAV